ncbi:MAG: sigma-70 family RNA polymerase sigma factor [Phycisphaerae bacterium]
MDHGRLNELLERGRRGDGEALGELVDRYSPRVFGMVLRLTGSRDTAEELVQETFLRVVRTLEAYEHGGKFEAWLFRIAANLARDHVRRQRRRGLMSALDADGQSCDFPEAISDARQYNPPDVRLERAEDGARLEAALARLGDLDREILMLRHHSDLSFREIAQMLRIPLGTALARAHRALQRLKAEFGAAEM